MGKDMDKIATVADEWITGSLEKEVNQRILTELPQLSTETRSIIEPNQQLSITKIIYAFAIQAGFPASHILSKPTYADILKTPCPKKVVYPPFRKKLGTLEIQPSPLSPTKTSKMFAAPAQDRTKVPKLSKLM
jgi:hypothetical protein